MNFKPIGLFPPDDLAFGPPIRALHSLYLVLYSQMFVTHDVAPYTHPSSLVVSTFLWLASTSHAVLPLITNSPHSFV